ncbi:MAG: hypothetical protein IJR95_07425 [Lachnospiraceae bacterium]|nr:hypothetical protein [Lachnospiraceae bacterium]
MGLLSKFIKQVVNTTAENVAEKEADKVAAKLADAVEQKLSQAAKDAKEAEVSLAEAAAGMKEAEATLKEAEKNGSLEQAFSFLGALAGAAKAEGEKQESAAVQADSALGQAADEEVTVPGQSWGPTMPAEENQYNFPGTPVQYFEKILAEDFPACRLEKEEPADSKATVFTLWQGDQQAAVIELLNKNSVRNKLRRDCRQAGIPYARFYYDAPGWWNTRVYVKERITKAMAGEI